MAHDRRVTGPIVVPNDERDFVRCYLRALLDSPEALITSVDPGDEMFAYTELADRGDTNQALCSYFGTGKQIFDTIAEVARWRFGGFQTVSSFLDFASGFGRSTRFILRELPPQRVWVSEISARALEFQRNEFGVHVLPSSPKPDGFVCDRRFQYVAVISLFTHLPEPTFVSWLRRLYGLLDESCGCLLFSTHGPSVNPQLAIPASGFWFEEKSEIQSLPTKDYGSTFVTERFVRDAIREATRGQGDFRRFPQGLCRFQDVYVVVPRQQAGNLHALNLTSGPIGYLDRCSIAPTEELRLMGWAADAQGIAQIQVFVNGKLLHTCTPSEPRPDVAAHFHNRAFLKSGFDCCLAPGRGRFLATDTLTIKLIANSKLVHVMYHNHLGAATTERRPAD